TLAGLRWSLATLGPPLVIGIAWSLLSRPPRPATEGSTPASWGWGDAVAVLALAVFAYCTARSWNLNSDFIYHWGIKGKPFALARGVDFRYLARPWSSHLHPDYPNLLPGLFALTALGDGGFREPVMALWSVAWFALLLLFGRELLASLGASRFALQTGMAVLGL